MIRPDYRFNTVSSIVKDVISGNISALSVAQTSLDKVTTSEEAGACTYTRVYRDTAPAEASRVDTLFQSCVASLALSGVPVSIKDLFNVRGETTLAASKVLQGAHPATHDAAVIARLRSAGTVIIGKTNMSEFAHDSYGVNTTYGMPVNPLAPLRIPGGSSSGAAASVANGTVVAAIGTDTGGSIRLPAAMCGIVGFKPSRSRSCNSGVFPLSTTFDTVGPLANSVECCASIDAVLCGASLEPLPELSLSGLKLGVPRAVAIDDMDETVGHAFERTLLQLATAGAVVEEFGWPELRLATWQPMFATIIWYEAYARHRVLLENRSYLYDDGSSELIIKGRDVTEENYRLALTERQRLIYSSLERIRPFDAIVMPTALVVAPERDAVLSPGFSGDAESRLDRNVEVANFFDCCGCSIPCQTPDELPVGLHLMGENGSDRRILTISAAVERCLREAGVT